MSGYYDPYPRFILTRPMVIAGQIGCGARRVGRALTARTGLPFAEIDRLIEHEAGCSLAQIAASEGPARVARWSLAVMERLATQRPYSLIVLDSAWPPTSSIKPLLRKLDFVHLQRDSAFLLERFDKERRRTGEWILDGLSTNEASADLLAPLRDRRLPLLREAQILLDAGKQNEIHTAELLLDSLEATVGAIPV